MSRNNDQRFQPYRHGGAGRSGPSNNQGPKYRVINEREAEINIHPYSRYDSAFPVFQQPVEVGILVSETRKAALEAVKTDENKEEYERARGLKYLVLPKNCDQVEFDLKPGMDKFVPHIPHIKGIDAILKWILENKKKLIHRKPNSYKILETDFVSWRGLLTTIAFIPYEKHKDLMFTIIFHRGTYYLCELETDLQLAERLVMDDKSKLFTYMGHKFESYVTSDLPNTEPPGLDDVPDQENNFACVVTTSLDEHKLLYPAEVDCCLNDEHKTLRDFCELKTSVGESLADLNLGRNVKFLKWWMQSFLIGIDKIKIGLRTEDGVVKRIVDFNINQITSQQNNRWWKENVCFNFLKSVLDLVKTFCVEENQIYVATREKGSSNLRIHKLDRNSADYEAKYFLRDWFTKNII